MKTSIFLALVWLALSSKSDATTYECTLEFQNSINSPVVIVFQSYNPELEIKLGKLRKLTIPEFQTNEVSFLNTPYVKWEVISPKHKLNVTKGSTATSCNSGGKVKIE